MGRQAGLCATVVVVASSLLWLVLVAVIVPGSAQAYRGSTVSMQVAATISPQATPTKRQPAPQGKTVQNEQVPSWVTLSLLLIGCAVLLAVLGFMLWIGGLLPWHRRGRRVGFVSRGRERAWWLVGAAVLAAVLWAIAQVLKWPVGLQVVLTVLAAAVALIVPELRARGAQDDTRERLLKQRVAVPIEHRQLPLVRDVGLEELGVHAARMQVPYIERDKQVEFEEAVGQGRAVLLVGHSMSGKTRMAAEVVKRKFPDARLVIAGSGKSLRELFDGGLDPAGIVVWLENLERFLGDGLDMNLLNRLITGRAIVVAAIRTEQWETYRPQNKLWPPEWDVLQRFSEISLQRRNTNAELNQIQAAVTDPRVLAAVKHYGLAEYLGAGPEALDKFEKGEIANPVGHALVRAAVDWRRTGLTRPVSEQVLARGLPTYLADRPDVPRTKQAIDEGLAWATAKINQTVALLGQVFTGSNGPVFEAFDYLVDQLTGTSTPVPDPMWSLALEQAESTELPVIGLAAYDAGKSATAETAWRQAADEAPGAANNLGVLLEEQGDLEGAKAAWQRAIDSGHPEAAPGAAYNLGVLLEEQGDLEGAKAAWQRAIDSGHADQAPRAARNLGVLLQKQGDLAGAKAAYQRAIDSGHPEAAPKAAYNLGVLLEEQGDLAGAKAAYQRAIASDHAEAAPMAAYNLGLLFQEQGDLAGAKAAYQRAIASGHAEAAPLAESNLGLLLEEQGDLAGAKTAYQRAIDSGHPDVAPRAAGNLGVLLKKQGDLAGAKTAYQRAIDSGHADYAPLAAGILGQLLEKQDDLAGAKTAYQRAIDSGHADYAPLAAFGLGLLLEEQDNLEGAKAAYQQAIDSGHPEAPTAAYHLGALLEEQGDIAGAKAAYQRAIDSGHAEAAPLAASALVALLRSTPPPAVS